MKYVKLTLLFALILNFTFGQNLDYESQVIRDYKNEIKDKSPQAKIAGDISGICDAFTTVTTQGAGIGWDDCAGATYLGTIEFESVDGERYNIYSEVTPGFPLNDISFGAYNACYGTTDQSSLPNESATSPTLHFNVDNSGQFSFVGASQWSEIYTMSNIVMNGAQLSLSWFNDYGEGADVQLERHDGLSWEELLVPQDSCCTNFDAFCQNVENAVSITTDPDFCKATFNMDDLPCDSYIEYVDWGNQGVISQGPFYPGDMAMNIYPGSGTYNVCYLAIELDNDGFICFEKLICDTIDLTCVCCTDSIAFFTAAANVETFGTLGDCMIHFNAHGLDSCMQISYDWGENPQIIDGPFGNETLVWHTFAGPGTYLVCYYIDEVDENGDICWTYENCEEILILCTPDPDTCLVAPSGMVAWWPMDEQIGDSNVKDIKGSNDGVPKPNGLIGLPNGPNPVPGIVDGALHYIGAPGSQYVEVNNDPSLNFGTGSFSIDAWINTNNGTQTEPIIDKLGSQSSGYSLSIQGTSPYNLTLAIGGSPLQILKGPPIITNQWNFVAVTVNTQTQTAMFYVGNSPGTLTQFPASFIGPTNATNTQSLFIGRNPFNPHVNIIIDELEIFDRALDSVEVASIWSADSLGKCKDIVDAVINLPQSSLIRVFPNPTLDKLTLEFEDFIPNESKLHIIDIWGRTLNTISLQSGQGQHEMSISSLPTGIYFIKITENGIPFWIEKIIKY